MIHLVSYLHDCHHCNWIQALISLTVQEVQISIDIKKLHIRLTPMTLSAKNGVPMYFVIKLYILVQYTQVTVILPYPYFEQNLCHHHKQSHMWNSHPVPTCLHID
eukprot:c12663_g1_i1 orf=53-367(+)